MKRSNFSLTHLEGEIMAIITIGIDLAKNVVAVHGVDETGKPVFVSPAVKRADLLELIAKLPPCFIGIDSLTNLNV
jgi:transposase